MCQNVQLVSLRVAQSDGNFDGDAIINAIRYAEDIGLPIINYSGSSTANTFRSAIEDYSGLFICAAGNASNNNDAIGYYPANNNDLPHLISVGASTESDAKRYDSNYGASKVDLFAPGNNICTTSSDGEYTVTGATSMATPYVTGVAALMLSTHPNLTPSRIKAILLDSVDRVSALENYCVSGGRLNAYKALTHESIHTHFSYVNNGIHVGHTGACLDCDYTTGIVAHTWVESGLRFRCGGCGILSAAIPVLPFNLPPEIIAKLEQMGYLGDFAMDIGGGTVLCRVGDDYYLVRGQTEDTALSYLQHELSVILPDHEAA